MRLLESQHTEWKASWRDDLLLWVCAFANADGGCLEIGRNDKGEMAARSGRLDPADLRVSDAALIEKLKLTEGTYLKTIATTSDAGAQSRVHDKKVMKLLTIGGLWLGERR